MSLRWLSWNTFSGILDVFLVFLLIYRILLLVRGTRAERMLLGLGIVVLVYLASGLLHLPTLNWILGNFLGSVILVIVVLFQDDLRRALTNVGLFPGFGSEKPQVLEISVREVAQAARELAEKRTGALIVIGRDVGLEEYTENAVKMDALVSHQLLVSIFQTTSPLHDGAVIIEGDRVVAAGAVLPLSFNPALSTRHGTRHRAALGLSEHTDALVVVVSEESGVISLVREGRVTQDLTEQTLYNSLHRLTVLRHARRARRRLGLFDSVPPEGADGGKRGGRTEQVDSSGENEGEGGGPELLSDGAVPKGVSEGREGTLPGSDQPIPVNTLPEGAPKGATERGDA